MPGFLRQIRRELQQILAPNRRRQFVRRRTNGVTTETLEPRTLLAADLVLDINTVPSTAGSNPTNLVEMSGTVFFTATADGYGQELWKSDGTAAGTVLVKDIASGSSFSSPRYLTNVNGTLYFAANDGVNGRELWKSDGTSAGTVMIKDIWTGSSSGYPRTLTNVNGTLYFTANDGINGAELWKSDGTVTGTVMVKDIHSGNNSSFGYPTHLTNVNGTLYFQANDGVTGNELWKSDGTTAGTVMVKDIYAVGNSSSTPIYLTNVNGTLYFTATDGVNGGELWRSDGTVAGTVMVKDIASGSNTGNPRYLTNVNGTLYFSANDYVSGVELWKSDGTVAGTAMVKDIRSGTSSGRPQVLTNVNGTLFFRADDGVNGIELWKSDGTSTGTKLVKDLITGPAGGMQSNFMAKYNGWAIFMANDNISGEELWISDGSPQGTRLLADVSPGGASSTPQMPVSINSSLIFAAYRSDVGQELWRIKLPSEASLSNSVLTLDLSQAVANRNLSLRLSNGMVNIIDLDTDSVLFGPESDLPIGDLQGLRIIGSPAYSESITIDHSAGVVNIPQGIVFDGGSGGNDSVSVIGATGVDAVYSQSGVDSMILSTSGTSGVSLTYRNVETVNLSGLRRISTTGNVNIDTNITASHQLPFDLGPITSLTGGSLSSNGTISLGSGESILGAGVIQGRISAEAGSLIHADGNMTLGVSTSVAGFLTRGELETSSSTVTLLDANQAVLGSLTTLGTTVATGSVVAANGALIDFGNNVVGFGTLQTPNSAAKLTFINGAVQGDSLAHPVTLTGYIKGVGTLDNVAITGTYSPGFSPAAVTLGNMIYASSSTTVIELAGTTAGSQYDQLNHVGQALLGGTLHVDLLNGYLPALGDTFTFLTATNGVTGTFDNVELPSLSGNLKWQLDYNANSIVLAIVPNNSAPTDLTLSPTSISENLPGGSAVGLFSSIDPDALNTFTYTLVTGTGSDDNGSFTIAGNSLKTAASFDFETKSSYTIRVRTTDQGGLWFEKAFLINVTDVDEIPPVVTSTSLLASGSLAAGTTSLTVTFSETVVGANAVGNYELRRSGADGFLGTADDVIVGLTSAIVSGTTATLNFAGQPTDIYRLTVKDTIVDTIGLSLDGDQNGVAGGNFVVQAAQVNSWDGGGTTNNWSEPANWFYDVVPFANDHLIFPAGAPRATNVNDFPVGTAFGAILISGNNYSLSGNTITLKGIVTSIGAGNTFGLSALLSPNGGFAYSGTDVFTVSSAINTNGYSLSLNTGSGTILLNNVISGSGSLITSGGGTTALSGTNTYTGTTTALAGTLAVRSNTALGSADGTTGTGTVLQGGQLQLENGVTVSNELLSSPVNNSISIVSAGVGRTNIWTGNIHSGAGLWLLPSSGNTLQVDGDISTVAAYVSIFTSGYYGDELVRLNGSVAGSDLYASCSVEVNSSVTLTGDSANVKNLSGIGSITGPAWAQVGAYVSGTLRPGSPNATGILTVGGVQFSANPAALFSVRLNGITAGSQYDRLNVNGAAYIAGNLNVSLGPGFTPAIGDVFTIITKDGTDPVVGTFSGLKEGALFATGSTAFRFSYTGGTGNDVTLTRIAARIWDGGGANDNWSTAANWAGGVAPTAGDALVFPAGASRLTSVNDFTSGTAFGSILISGSNYSVSGNAIAMNGTVTSFGVGNTFSLNALLSPNGGFAYSGTDVFTVSSAIDTNGNSLSLNTGSGTMLLNNVISGSGNLITSGAGTTALSGTNTYTGTTTALAGTLAVRSNKALGSADGTTGTGTILQGGQLQLENGVTVSSELLSSPAGSGVTLYSLGGGQTNTWTGDIQSSGAFYVALNSNNNLLQLDGDVVASGRVNAYGASGTLLRFNQRLQSSDYLYCGGYVDVEVNSNATFGSGIESTWETTLSGTGQISWNAYSDLEGVIAPGTRSATGILTLNGPTTLYNGSMNFRINGITAGTQYDRLNVNGGLAISGAFALNVSLGASFIPAVGDVFTIIDNDGVDAIAGTFNRISEGAIYVIGNSVFRFSYAGGTGNDVTLTCIAARVWNGGGPNANWSTAANWAGGVAPTAGDVLVFPSGASRSANLNDFTPGTSFGSILISGNNYSLSGNSVALNDTVASTGSGNTFGLNVQLNPNGGFTYTGNDVFIVASAIDTNGNPLNLTTSSGAMLLSNVISGAGSVITSGGGTTALSGTNTYTGTTTALAGTLAVRSNKALGSADGTTGTGTVLQGGQLQLENGVTVSNELLRSSAGNGVYIGSAGVGQTNIWTGNIQSSGAFSAWTSSNDNTLQVDGSIVAAERVTGGSNGSGGLLRLNNSLQGQDFAATSPSLVIEVNSTAVFTGSFELGWGSTLSGTGSLSWSSYSDIWVSRFIQPGTRSSTGILTLSGPSADSSGSMAFRINGTTAGTQYDRLNFNGTLGISGALNVSLGAGFTPAVGDVFTIIDNDGVDAIGGTFNGIAENGVLNYYGTIFRVSYVGGTGNDVTLTVVAANHAPINLMLSNSSIAENQASGTTVGTFSTSDPDVGNTFTYTLVTGTGSTDNSSFTIAGNSLKTAASFDFETKSSYSIRVRSTDQDGLFTERTLVISVTDVVEDVTAPTSAVNSLPSNATSLAIPITVTGNDPNGPEGPASGVHHYDLYVSVGGAAYVKFATVPAANPTTTYTASSNQIYWFRSVAVDNTGNIESKPLAAEAVIRTGDFDKPVTAVTSASPNAQGLFQIAMSGSDVGGGKVSRFDVYVSRDGGAATLISSVAASVPNGAGVSTAAVTYQGLADGNSHTYRFYSVGVDTSGNAEDAPASGDVVVTQTFAVITQLTATGIDVQLGATERSFVEYVDVLFSDAAQLATWLNAGGASKVQVEKFAIDATAVTPGTGAIVAGYSMAAVGNHLRIDFGANGLGGSRTTAAGDGFYRVRLDQNGNSSFADASDAAFEFHRLFGDANGNGVVDSADTALVNSMLGRTGSNLDGDLDGNGVVNTLDKLYATRQQGRKLRDWMLALLDD